MSTAQNIIKDTKYCEIHNQGRYIDNDYTYCIEKIYVKALNRFEIRFSLYKDIENHAEKYIARSLDVTELELVELFKNSMSNNVFSAELIESLKKVLSTSKKHKSASLIKEKIIRNNAEIAQIEHSTREENKDE